MEERGSWGWGEEGEVSETHPNVFPLEFLFTQNGLQRLAQAFRVVVHGRIVYVPDYPNHSFFLHAERVTESPATTHASMRRMARASMRSMSTFLPLSGLDAFISQENASGMLSSLACVPTEAYQGPGNRRVRCLDFLFSGSTP